MATIDDRGLLQLWHNDQQGKWTEAGSLQLNVQAEGMLAADLFLVDSSDPDRLRSDLKSTVGSDLDLAATGRHDTFANLIVFGVEGIQLIQMDGRSLATAETRLRRVYGTTGLEELSGVTAVVAGDLEADGDLDSLSSRRTRVRCVYSSTEGTERSSNRRDG